MPHTSLEGLALPDPNEAATIGLAVTNPSEPPAERGPSPFALLFAPDRGMERQARVGRAARLFLVAWLCSLLLGAALAYRVDARSSTLQKLEQTGQLKSMSDRQIDEETHNAERVSQVGSIAKGVVGPPLQLGGACLALIALGWFFRGRIKGSSVVPVAAATLLPAALANVLDAAVAYRHAAIPPEGVELAPRTLADVMPLVHHPLVGVWQKLGGAVDFFSLWSAVLLAFGLAAAAKVPKKSAIPGTLIAWVCYRLLTHVAVG